MSPRYPRRIFGSGYFPEFIETMWLSNVKYYHVKCQFCLEEILPPSLAYANRPGAFKARGRWCCMECALRKVEEQQIDWILRYGSKLQNSWY